MKQKNPKNLVFCPMAVVPAAAAAAACHILRCTECCVADVSSRQLSLGFSSLVT